MKNKLNHSGSNLPDDASFMQLTLRLAKRGWGSTSPNPMVGAVLVRNGSVIGQGWHRRAGLPHAEIEALRDAELRGQRVKGATLYVTLEPCSTHGRTPPCTDAILGSGIRTVVVGATDPNPKHSGKGYAVLRRAGIRVRVLSKSRQAADRAVAVECAHLNEAFNHWVVHRTPFVVVKAAMTLDGKIATASGESKWITGPKAREVGMQLRRGSDAILIGVNTVLADDPSLTIRPALGQRKGPLARTDPPPRLRRIVLDSMARTPIEAKLVRDAAASLTTIVVSGRAPGDRVAALAKHVNVLVAPVPGRSRIKDPVGINLDWLMKKLGTENVTSLLVEGGGEVNASFLFGGFAHRIAFFYAPRILGGRHSRKAVAGIGAESLDQVLDLETVSWESAGTDLYLSARIKPRG